ncbi:ABC transporter ATP-binding protein/permease [Alphaproteobacteria bacterium]|nr:ABC transporter ATP-binding protein/permease [Alphaproteobacteria bacterium]
MSFFKSYTLFQRYIGKRLYKSLLLSMLATLSESLGIVLILPLVELLTQGGSQIEYEPAFLPKFSLDVYFILLLILVFFLIKATFMYLALSFNASTRAVFIVELKRRLYRNLVSMGYLDFVNKSSGEVNSLINEQAGRALQSYIQFSHANTMVVQGIIYMSIGFYLSPIFGATTIFLGLLLFVFMRRLSQYVRKLSNKTALSGLLLSKHLNELLSSFKYLSATGGFKKLERQTLNSIEDLGNYQRLVGKAAGFTQSIKEPLAILVIGVSIFFETTVNGAHTGSLVATVALFYRGFSSVIGFQISWQNTLEYKSSLETIDAELAISKRETAAIGNSLEFSNSDEPSIECANINVSIKGELILDKINIKLRPGSVNAFVGASGAGKSTLVDVIAGIIKPNEGNVIVDGVPLCSSYISAWQKSLGYVTPEAILFSGTVLENITFFGQDREDEFIDINLVEAVLAKVGLLEFFALKKSGLQTLVGEGGSSLSAGQRQRLLIARELYKQPKVLIMDEATSALDISSQELIIDLTRALKGDVLLILVAHRVEVLRHADQIFMFDDGRIIDTYNGFSDYLSRVEIGKTNE